ncbi:MAG: hypothetical protein GTN69_01740 [Armatimonadetes bacterium]|nr:hypothetical protein [Armatimonadota bacterium]NIO74622.1 hypothetical protein [Armatimonadota bacterium]NIO95563.1 hypothetical protein [Armatimonadota bacterium]
MASSKQPNENPLEGITHPMFQLDSPRLTRKEKSLKQEVDAYLVSDVRDTARIQIGEKNHDIKNAIDLPDATSGGLTFKMRVVHLKKGPCYLLARWKPDRYMRRNTGGLSQKWFIEKRLFPPNRERFFERMQARAEEAQEASES